MTDLRKQKLISLGPDVLAQSLLDIAVHSAEAIDLIEQLIATPKENIQRFKHKLSELKQQQRFISWREAASFVRELERLLKDLKYGANDPLTGVQLVASFYEMDATIFEMCDDSGGDIGYVFEYDAKDLFVHYASRCSDKDKIANIILKLNQNDDYGIRDTLINCAGEFLSEEIVRTMIGTLRTQADSENDKYNRRHYLGLISSLAKQIKDIKLFEKVQIDLWGELNSAAIIDIAQIYLENGEVDLAHCWLKEVPDNEVVQSYERDKLLEEIYRKQGDTEKLAEFFFQKFKSFYTTDNLQKLLDVIGHDKRDEVITEAAEQILKSGTFWEWDVEFLIAVGKIDEAQTHLLGHVNQLSGNNYNSLLSIAEDMESEKRYLVVCLIYRRLLVSILERGYTKAYPHGVRYLRKLDRLSKAVTDWKEFNDHETFKRHITRIHGRKRSFWSQYGEKNE